MPINYDVEYPKLQRLAEDRKYEVERLIADCEMKDKRIDWTVADNAKKAIEIDRLTAEIEQLQERMQKAHNHLINLQPHIPQACYPGHEAFIDSHIDEAMKLLSETTKDAHRSVKDCWNCMATLASSAGYCNVCGRSQNESPLRAGSPSL